MTPFADLDRALVALCQFPYRRQAARLCLFCADECRDRPVRDSAVVADRYARISRVVRTFDHHRPTHCVGAMDLLHDDAPDANFLDCLNLASAVVRLDPSAASTHDALTQFNSFIYSMTRLAALNHPDTGRVVDAAYALNPLFFPLKPEHRTSTARQLATAMHKARDFSAMPILADALNDAGCNHLVALDNMRDPDFPWFDGNAVTECLRRAT